MAQSMSNPTWRIDLESIQSSPWYYWQTSENLKERKGMPSIRQQSKIIERVAVHVHCPHCTSKRNGNICALTIHPRNCNSLEKDNEQECHSRDSITVNKLKQVNATLKHAWRGSKVVMNSSVPSSNHNNKKYESVLKTMLPIFVHLKTGKVIRVK